MQAGQYLVKLLEQFSAKKNKKNNRKLKRVQKCNQSPKHSLLPPDGRVQLIFDVAQHRHKLHHVDHDGGTGREPNPRQRVHHHRGFVDGVGRRTDAHPVQQVAIQQRPDGELRQRPVRDEALPAGDVAQQLQAAGELPLEEGRFRLLHSVCGGRLSWSWIELFQ